MVHGAVSHDVSTLKRILDEGRSAWTVDTDAKLLVRRVPGAEAAFAAIKGTPHRRRHPAERVDEGIRPAPGRGRATR